MSKIPESADNKHSGINKGATLHNLAFDHSLQANIITRVSNGKIIAVNIAACKLLGYEKNELMDKNRASIFNLNESSFKKMLKQRLSEGQSSASVTVMRKNGELLPCEITSAIFLDDGVEKAITTIVDRSRSILKQKNKDTRNRKIVSDNIIIAQTKSDVRLAENNEWIKCIAKTSYDVMWDWNINTGEIYVGDSIREVFGYSVLNNSVQFNEVSRCLHAEEKVVVHKKIKETLESVSKSWNDSFSFKRKDGSVAFAVGRASIVRDEENKAIRMIGALQDVSKVQDLENRLEEQIAIQKGENRKSLFTLNYASEVIWDWNILTDDFFIGEGFEELFGPAIKNNKVKMEDVRTRIHADDKKLVDEKLSTAFLSSVKQMEHEYRIVRSDGLVVNVVDKASIFRDVDGKAYRMIGVMREINEKTDQSAAFNIIEDKKKILINKIKEIIVGLIRHSNEQLQSNFSDYLSKKLQYDYTYLANLFSESKGIPIQTFIITEKIELVKELILQEQLNMTQIAAKLHYSSVPHLSNQFKKVTGVTPTLFKLNENKKQPFIER